MPVVLLCVLRHCHHTRPVGQRFQWTSVRRNVEQVVRRFLKPALVIEFPVGFCMSLASSVTGNDRSGLSCDRYAALITTLR